MSDQEPGPHLVTRDPNTGTVPQTIYSMSDQRSHSQDTIYPTEAPTTQTTYPQTNVYTTQHLYHTNVSRSKETIRTCRRGLVYRYRNGCVESGHRSSQGLEGE